jgi:hypothetical protein
MNMTINNPGIPMGSFHGNKYGEGEGEGEGDTSNKITRTLITLYKPLRIFITLDERPYKDEYNR